jgi:hypothetical protein
LDLIWWLSKRTASIACCYMSKLASCAIEQFPGLEKSRQVIFPLIL